MGCHVKIVWKIAFREGIVFEYKAKDINALHEIAQAIPGKCHKALFFISSSLCKLTSATIYGVFVNAGNSWQLRLSYMQKSFHIVIKKDPYRIREQELYELKTIDLEQEYPVCQQKNTPLL